MRDQTPGQPSPTLLPTSINWSCSSGVVFHYERQRPDDLVASGLLAADEIPQGRRKNLGEGAIRINAAKGGTFNVIAEADTILLRDRPFKRFIGALLADTRLSLVKGEMA